MLISSSDKQQDGNVQERLYHMHKISRTIPQYNTHMLTFFALNLYPIRNEDTLNQDNQFIHVAYFLIIVSVICS